MAETEQRQVDLLLAKPRSIDQILRASSTALQQKGAFLEGDEKGDFYLSILDAEDPHPYISLMWPIGSVRPCDSRTAAFILVPLLDCAVLFDSAPDQYGFCWVAVLPDGSTISLREIEDTGEPVWEDLNL